MYLPVHVGPGCCVGGRSSRVQRPRTSFGVRRGSVSNAQPYLRLAGFLLFCLAATWACLAASVVNFKSYRHYRTLGPLEHISDAEFLSVPASALPRRWPDPRFRPRHPDLRTPIRCHAYAQLAATRASNFVLAGEGLLLLSGALIGMLLPQLVADSTSGSSPSLTFAAIFATATATSGLLLRQVVGQRWFRWAALYRRAVEPPSC